MWSPSAKALLRSWDCEQWPLLGLHASWNQDMKWAEVPAGGSWSNPEALPLSPPPAHLSPHMDPWLKLAGLRAPTQARSAHLQPLGPVDGPQWPEHPQDSQDLHHIDGTGPGGVDGRVNHSCFWARRREGECMGVLEKVSHLQGPGAILGAGDLVSKSWEKNLPCVVSITMCCSRPFTQPRGCREAELHQTPATEDTLPNCSEPQFLYP